MKTLKADSILRQLMCNAHPDYFMKMPKVAATNTETLKLISSVLSDESNRAPRMEKIYLKPLTADADPAECFIRVASANETRRSVHELLEKCGCAPARFDADAEQGTFERRYCGSYETTASPELWDLAARFVKNRNHNKRILLSE